MAEILLLGFFGGLVLNLMPCVFPVLGIKVMGFVGQAGERKAKVVLHGLTFTLGVLLSFWVLAGALLALRAGGEELGWGFQLQNPFFNFVLAIFLLLFALNMSGVFEIGQKAVGVGSGLSARRGLQGSFFSGVLATIVATPCAAPLLGTALGSALTLPALASMATFTAIALGLSAPYLVFSAFPSLVRLLPRPGPWMETFKQGMAFLIYATVAYLFWILSTQLVEAAGYSASAPLKAAFTLVGVAFAAWVFGRYTQLHLARRTRLFGAAVAALAFALALFVGWPAKTEMRWQTWEPGKAEALAAEGKIVYVDFTASWCVTCIANKENVFRDGEVVELFTSGKAVALKADWTNTDPEITRELARYNRSAVPFNLVYGPGLDEPLILPELLTPGIVLDKLGEASAPSAPGSVALR